MLYEKIIIKYSSYNLYPNVLPIQYKKYSTIQYIKTLDFENILLIFKIIKYVCYVYYHLVLVINYHLAFKAVVVLLDKIFIKAF